MIRDPIYYTLYYILASYDIFSPKRDAFQVVVANTPRMPPASLQISDKMSRYHPWSLKWLRLWVVTRLLRTLIYFQRFRHPFPLFKNPDVLRTEEHIPSRVKGRKIRVRCYRPAFSSADDTLPVLINFHGSGFCVDALGQDESWCATVVEETGWMVIDADYRKAPEHPFPLPLEDAQDVALHVLARGPHTTLSLSGFSSGGTLALGLAGILGADRVHSVAVFYPTTDIAVDITRPSADPLLPPALMRHFFECYVLPGTSPTDARLAPAYARAEDMPLHVWIAAGADDPLHDAAAALVRRLQREGRPGASFVSVPRVGHGFDKIIPGVAVSPEGAKVYKSAVDFLRQSVG